MNKSKTGTVGRGFIPFKSIGERAAFGAYMDELYSVNGGRTDVSRRTGVSAETLGKYVTGRATPSRATVDALITAGILPADPPLQTPEDFVDAAPWKANRYRKAGRERMDGIANAQVGREHNDCTPGACLVGDGNCWPLYKETQDQFAGKTSLKLETELGSAPASNEGTPAPAAPPNLIDAVMAEPGLSAKQQAQLAALIAMVVNGVQLDITVSPKWGL